MHPDMAPCVHPDMVPLHTPRHGAAACTLTRCCRMHPDMVLPHRPRQGAAACLLTQGAAACTLTWCGGSPVQVCLVFGPGVLGQPTGCFRCSVPCHCLLPSTSPTLDIISPSLHRARMFLVLSSLYTQSLFPRKTLETYLP